MCLLQRGCALLVGRRRRCRCCCRRRRRRRRRCYSCWWLIGWSWWGTEGGDQEGRLDLQRGAGQRLCRPAVPVPVAIAITVVRRRGLLWLLSSCLSVNGRALWGYAKGSRTRTGACGKFSSSPPGMLCCRVSACKRISCLHACYYTRPLLVAGPTNRSVLVCGGGFRSKARLEIWAYL